MQLAQQKYSKLLNTVYIKPNVRGKTFFQDQIGEWAMSTKGGRNVQTPNNDPNLARRMGVMLDYHDNRMLDRGDELKCISDPRSAYTIAAARSLGRKIDDVIIAAAVSTTTASGETGSTTAPTCASVTITTGSLYITDVAEMKLALDNSDVEAEDRYLVITPTLLSSALQQTTMTSADYAAVKALVNGEIDTFMGFKWIVSTRIAEQSGLEGLVYHKNALCLAMAAQPMVRTDERADLSYSWQVYYELNCGAVRLEESRIRKIRT
uniref:Putative capsid protein n=1 Tax=viral metagenome TaxID=1070528 RepID=A0A6M3L089_9ZZZZ